MDEETKNLIRDMKEAVEENNRLLEKLIDIDTQMVDGWYYENDDPDDNPSEFLQFG